MKRLCTLSSSLSLRTSHRTLPLVIRATSHALHVSSPNNAVPLPTTATGPPPAAPVSANDEKIIRRQRQAELLRHVRDSQVKPASGLKKRFWKDVSVKTDSEGTHTIYLDTRAVRNPSTKIPLPIPHSKPHLATAVAVEWDLLTSAQDTLRTHLLPLTSITSRAHDILQEEHPNAPTRSTRTRDEIVTSLLSYLNTDTLLCWAPPSSTFQQNINGAFQSPPPTLRDLQIRVAKPIIEFLATHVWRAVELVPALNPDSILPVSQPAASQSIIRGWILGLDAWELAGLERATLAGKSLLVATRLLVEWAEGFREIRERARQRQSSGEEGEDGASAEGTRFGIEEAAEACSVEVRWQTGRWGEVEDTHDVEKEDLRRQFGSVVVLVSGSGG